MMAEILGSEILNLGSLWVPPGSRSSGESSAINSRHEYRECD